MRTYVSKAVHTPALCVCGCGRPLPCPRRPDRQYARQACKFRTAHKAARPLADDLPADRIEALIEQARQQQRYARVRGVGR